MNVWLYILLPIVTFGAIFWDDSARAKRTKHRRLIEKGYGFLLSIEERDDVLSKDSIKVLKPLQKPRTIKKTV